MKKETKNLFEKLRKKGQNKAKRKERNKITNKESKMCKI